MKTFSFSNNTKPASPTVADAILTMWGDVLAGKVVLTATYKGDPDTGERKITLVAAASDVPASPTT